MSQRTEVISSWEHDPDQGFTEEEMEILKNAGLISEQVQKIL